MKRFSIRLEIHETLTVEPDAKAIYLALVNAGTDAMIWCVRRRMRSRYLGRQWDWLGDRSIAVAWWASERLHARRTREAAGAG